MDGSGPDWKGLLKWSIAHSDGTQAPRQLRYGDSLLGAIWLSICGGLLVCLIISSARLVPNKSGSFSTFREFGLRVPSILHARVVTVCCLKLFVKDVVEKIVHYSPFESHFDCLLP